MTTTIRSRKLTKTYGEHTVVDRLDLDIEVGEVFGLLGPNGAGKTTTILMLLGLVEPTKGKIEVLGLDPRWNPLEVKRKVGYLPDAVGFYDTMTGRTCGSPPDSTVSRTTRTALIHSSTWWGWVRPATRPPASTPEA
jgi:ABC-type multidrug transport system ATPase subunit